MFSDSVYATWDSVIPPILPPQTYQSQGCPYTKQEILPRDSAAGIDCQHPRSVAVNAIHNHQREVVVSLHNAGMWRKFDKIGTEMIVTKVGRRMFPSLSYSIEGLHPTKQYTLSIDVISVDDCRYKFYDSEWLASGKVDSPVPMTTYVHPDSPALGSFWMHKPVMFHKLKLTNNRKSQQGNVIVNTMQKYKPRLHISMADDRPEQALTKTFTFAETTFIPVTAYQSEEITKLKIDNNPFAKGFRENKDESSRTMTKKRLRSESEDTSDVQPESKRRQVNPSHTQTPQKDYSPQSYPPTPVVDSPIPAWDNHILPAFSSVSPVFSRSYDEISYDNRNFHSCHQFSHQATCSSVLQYSNDLFALAALCEPSLRLTPDFEQLKADIFDISKNKDDISLPVTDDEDSHISPDSLVPSLGICESSPDGDVLPDSSNSSIGSGGYHGYCDDTKEIVKSFVSEELHVTSENYNHDILREAMSMTFTPSDL